MSHFPLTLTASRELAPGLFHFSFQRSDGEPIATLASTVVYRDPALKGGA